MLSRALSHHLYDAHVSDNRNVHTNHARALQIHSLVKSIVERQTTAHRAKLVNTTHLSTATCVEHVYTYHVGGTRERVAFLSHNVTTLPPTRMRVYTQYSTHITYCACACQYSNGQRRRRPGCRRRSRCHPRRVLCTHFPTPVRAVCACVSHARLNAINTSKRRRLRLGANRARALDN